MIRQVGFVQAASSQNRCQNLCKIIATHRVFMTNMQGQCDNRSGKKHHLEQSIVEKFTI